MKDYPYETFKTDQGEQFKVPTKEAIKNFESYLSYHEKMYYNGLSMVYKMRIALSVNPFEMFKIIQSEPGLKT